MRAHKYLLIFIPSVKPITNKELKTALSIDIGGTNTKLAWIDSNGQFLKEGSFVTSDISDSRPYAERLIQYIENFLDSEFSIEGIGIGAPSSNELTGCIENPANLPIKGSFPIVQILSQHFDLPVYLLKDANAAVLGEFYFGGGKEMSSIVVVTLGTGLGCGIIIDGNLLRGKRGMAGELGHVPVFYPKRKCGCGKEGCLETYVSARGVVRTAFEFMAKYNDSSLLRDIPFSKLDSRMIFESAKSGDGLSKNIFEFTGTVLGEKLAEVVTLIEPEKIILAGGLAEAGEFLLPYVHKFLENNLIVTLKNRVVVEVSELGMNKAALLGAASVIFNISHLSPYKNNLKVNLP